MSLISEFAREASDPDYTLDSVTVVNDDLAYAIGYDAADSSYFILRGERDRDRGIVFAPWPGARFDFISEALENVGYKIERGE